MTYSLHVTALAYFQLPTIFGIEAQHFDHNKDDVVYTATGGQVKIAKREKSVEPSNTPTVRR